MNKWCYLSIGLNIVGLGWCWHSFLLNPYFGELPRPLWHSLAPFIMMYKLKYINTWEQTKLIL